MTKTVFTERGGVEDKPPLPKILPKDYGRKLEEKDAEIRLDPTQATYAVEKFRLMVHNAAKAQKTANKAVDTPEFPKKHREYAAAQRKVDAVLEEGGVAIERAHRDYLKNELRFRRFLRKRLDHLDIGRELELRPSETAAEVRMSLSPIVSKAPPVAGKHVARVQKAGFEDVGGVTLEEELAYLGKVLPEGTGRGVVDGLRRELEAADKEKGTPLQRAFAEYYEKIQGGRPAEKLPKRDAFREFLKTRNRSELVSGRARLEGEIDNEWRDPVLQYFYQREQVRSLVSALERGEEVLELPYTVGKLNDIHDMEKHNPGTTIGAVIVGDPGTGKTTLARYYLTQKGRNWAYMDVSGEVTRYQMFGSKSLQMETPLKAFQELQAAVESMDDGHIGKMIQKGIDRYGRSFANLVEEESSGTNKEKLQDVLKDRFADVVADEFFKFGRENGWRYGFVIDCLRRSVCPILDEFNKMDPRGYALLHGLLTATPASDKEASPEPGTDPESIKSSPKGWYYFGDNNEWMRVPENWRIYFTGNVGVEHIVYIAPPALRSRMEGAVVQLNYPPVAQEKMVAHAHLTDPDLEFRQSPEVAEGLKILIENVYPQIRGIKKPDVHPVSLRTTRDICARLYDRKSETQSGTTTADLDNAIAEVMLDVYALSEKKETAAEVADVLTINNLCLSREVEPKMLELMKIKYGDRAKEELEKRRTAWGEMKRGYLFSLGTEVDVAGLSKGFTSLGLRVNGEFTKEKIAVDRDDAGRKWTATTTEEQTWIIRHDEKKNELRIYENTEEDDNLRAQLNVEQDAGDKDKFRIYKRELGGESYYPHQSMLFDRPVL